MLVCCTLSVSNCAAPADLAALVHGAESALGSNQAQDMIDQIARKYDNAGPGMTMRPPPFNQGMMGGPSELRASSLACRLRLTSALISVRQFGPPGGFGGPPGGGYGGPPPGFNQGGPPMGMPMRQFGPPPGQFGGQPPPMGMGGPSQGVFPAGLVNSAR